MNGLLPAGIQLGLLSLVKGPWRGIKSQRAPGETGYFDPIQADVVIEEVPRDELEITDHPVENTASISDHAYKHPKEVKISWGWSDSPTSIGPWYAGVGTAAGAATGLLPNDLAVAAGRVAAGVSIASIASKDPSRVTMYYERLLTLQEQRELVTLYTGRRVYRNMLLKSIHSITNKDSAYSMVIEMTVREVIIVTTSTVTLKGDAADIAKRGQQYLNPAVRGN